LAAKVSDICKRFGIGETAYYKALHSRNGKWPEVKVKKRPPQLPRDILTSAEREILIRVKRLEEENHVLLRLMLEES
jgi:transposase-like protein